MAGVTPYSFEPSYSQEQMSKLAEQDLAKKDRLERFVGRAGNIEWCKCGFCRPMPTDMESLCCQESSTITDLRKTDDCITLHEAYDSITRNIHVLNTVRHNYIMHTKCKEIKKKPHCSTFICGACMFLQSSSVFSLLYLFTY